MATKVSSLYVEVGANTKPLEQGLQRTEQALGNTAKQAQTLGSKIGDFAKGFGKFAIETGVVALGAAFVASTKAAMELESEFGKIAALTDTPTSAIAGLRKEVLALSSDLPISSKELAQGLYFISSSGFQGAEAMEVLKVSATAAAAGLGETKVIADAVTSALNAYNLETKDAARITDLLTFAVKEGKGEPAELAGSLGRVLPVAAAAKVGMEDVAAAMAIMTRTGMSAEEAATSLRGTISALLAPAKQSAEAMAAIGLTTQDVATMLAKPGGLVAVLQLMMERTGGNVEQLDMMIPNIRALTGVLSLAGSQSEDYAAALTDAYNATGLTNKAAEEMSKTMEFKLKKAQNAVENLGISITEKLLPGLGDAAEAATTLLTATDKLDRAFEGTSDQIRKNTTKYADYQAAILGIAVASGKMSQAEADGLRSGTARQVLIDQATRSLGYMTEATWNAYRSATALGDYTDGAFRSGMQASATATKEAGEAIGWTAIETEKAAKAAEKLSSATADMLTSYLEATEGFKDIEPLNIARAALERLSQLMKDDPANIERYQKQFEELQLTYGLITPAAQAAQASANQLTSALIAGIIGPDEYKKAVERLQVAAKDGTVYVNELGLSALTASKYFSFISPPVSEAAKKLVELKRDADGATDALNKIPTDIKIKVSYDIGKVPEFALPPVQGPPSPKPATPTVKPTIKPPVRGGKGELARGGFAMPQQSYTVGENGPELLQMFGSGGHVTPMGGSGGKGLTIVNYITAPPSMNMDALAARVSQKIARNLRSAVSSGAGYTGG